MLLPRLWLFNLTFQKWKAKQITGCKMYKECTWLFLKNPGAISAQSKMGQIIFAVHIFLSKISSCGAGVTFQMTCLEDDDLGLWSQSWP